MKVKSLSRVRLFVTPWSAAYQAPPSMGFSRQEYWSGGAIAFSRHIRLLNGKFMIIRGAYKKELGVGEEERNRKHLGPIQQNALRKQWRKQQNDLTSPVK